MQSFENINQRNTKNKEIFINTKGKEMQQPDSIDYNSLTFLDPPESSNPTSSDITEKIQQRFYEQCLSFLSKQKKFYKCSKKIEIKLNNSIKESVELDDHVRTQANRIERVERQLKKINQNFDDAGKRQEFLASICKFVNMEDARKVILQPKIVDEAEFIEKLRELDVMSQQINSLQSDIKIIVQIRQQISLLLQQTADKMIKGNLSDSLIKRITSDFAQPFLRDPKTSTTFLSNLTNQRLNKFRVALNPLINNINYVQNITELYQKIGEEWIKLIDQQLSIFNKETNPKQIRHIPKQVMTRLIAQVVPKMERGIFKVKNVVDVARIRFVMMMLKGRVQVCGEGVWDLLSKLLIKMLIILEEKLEQAAQQLQIAKYNVHSMVSYVPIRQHIQLIRQAKSYDPNNKQIGWQRGFKRLADSRDPSKQPNNKSLIIFNLNIWYLYSHVMKQQGQYYEKAQKMIKDCITSLVNLNLINLRKQNQSKSLQKLLDLCANSQATKKTLQSEINLLGHQKLRNLVQRQLSNAFIQQIYLPLLKQFKLEAGLENVEVIELANKEKLNLNKYGKESETIKILTAQQMKEVFS